MNKKILSWLFWLPVVILGLFAVNFLWFSPELESNTKTLYAAFFLIPSFVIGYFANKYDQQNKINNYA
jgi:bacteriorhodopsin